MPTFSPAQQDAILSYDSQELLIPHPRVTLLATRSARRGTSATGGICSRRIVGDISSNLATSSNSHRMERGNRPVRETDEDGDTDEDEEDDESSDSRAITTSSESDEESEDDHSYPRPFLKRLINRTRLCFL